jgi:hypothetical protein
MMTGKWLTPDHGPTCPPECLCMCMAHAELETLELVRCEGTSWACLPAIAAHGATLRKLGLDRSCAGPMSCEWAAALKPLPVCGVKPIPCSAKSRLAVLACCLLSLIHKHGPADSSTFRLTIVALSEAPCP